MGYVVVKSKDAKALEIPPLTVISYLSSEQLKTHDLGRVIVRGKHYKCMTKDSNRIYYVLKGEGRLITNEGVKVINEGDAFLIRPKSPYSIEGDLELICTFSPPFRPEDEVRLES